MKFIEIRKEGEAYKIDNQAHQDKTPLPPLFFLFSLSPKLWNDKGHGRELWALEQDDGVF